MNTLLLTISCIIAIVAIWGLVRRQLPNRHHRRMIRAAARALDLLAPIATSKTPAMFTYIRKMHPHAVEELVLLAAERAGHRIKRNTRYVGDGGIDGMIQVNGAWHLVQTKRYSSAIKPEHVREFTALCQAKRKPGLFIHFGRTGPMSKDACGDMVQIISGSRAATLIAGEGIEITAGADALAHSEHSRARRVAPSSVPYASHGRR